LQALVGRMQARVTRRRADVVRLDVVGEHARARLLEARADEAEVWAEALARALVNEEIRHE